MSALITILGTILAAVVTAAVGIRSYRSQKDTDRQIELRKQQRAAYEAYMRSYYDWTYTEDGSDEDEKAKDEYRQAYFKLFPLASDGFLRAAMAFHTYVWEAPYPDFAKKADRENFEKLWGSLERCAKQLIECRCYAHKCLEDGLEITAMLDPQLI